MWEGASDPLRNDLASVFEELGWRGAGDFREELLNRHCYFVHAVKCWRAVEKPSVDAIRRCSPLLTEDIADLKPANLCILGSLAHVAACLALPGLPSFEKFNYGRGWNGEMTGINVIITTFANRRQNRGQNKLNRECVADALRRWVR